MVNYADIIADTNSQIFNVRDEYKDNAIDENIEICKADRLPFSVGCINITGDLNVGMMIQISVFNGRRELLHFWTQEI